MTNKAYSYAIRTLSMLLRCFAILIGVNIIALCCVNRVDISNLLEGVIMGIGIGAIIAITLVWVPLMNSLRKKMNTLVNEIAIKH